MARARPLNRRAIVDAMAGEIEPLPYVHAFWESGAAPFNRADASSDSDLYIVVD